MNEWILYFKGQRYSSVSQAANMAAVAGNAFIKVQQIQESFGLNLVKDRCQAIHKQDIRGKGKIIKTRYTEQIKKKKK